MGERWARDGGRWAGDGGTYLPTYLSTYILIAKNATTLGSCWADKGQHFPVHLKTLDDLKLVEAQVNHTQKMMEDPRKHAGLLPKNTKGNREKMKSNERIPKKPKASQGAESNGGYPKTN